MLSRLKAWLFLPAAQKRRAETMRLLREAEAVGDCRRIGYLRMVLAADTVSELKATWG